MGIYASDLESTGLLDDLLIQESPKMHNFCSLDINSDEHFLFHGTQKKDIQDWLDQGHTFLIHNGKCYDGEVLTFFGFDISKCTIIDTLALSWYLEPNRIKHGLESYGEEFGIKKPEIIDWETQTQADYDRRVMEDCRIQKALWLRQEKKLRILYGSEVGKYDSFLAFMMWKMEELRQQQIHRWKFDADSAQELEQQLAKEVEEKVEALKLVMPKVPVYAVRKKPAKPFLKTGELSATGIKWKDLTESLGLPFDHAEDIKVVTDEVIGNPASHVQMKNWLDSLGWIPETFKFVREDDGTTRQIPQINLKGGEICQSVKDLIPKCAGIEHIAGLGILNHRHSVVKGFIRDAFKGELTARTQGFTNTLRCQHREIVNLPSLRVKYGKELRSLLVAREGMILLGSDLNSLEDRLKHHLQWKYDPEYVTSQMTDGFDPHLTIAVSADLMSKDEQEFYVWYKANHKE